MTASGDGSIKLWDMMLNVSVGPKVASVCSDAMNVGSADTSVA